MKITVLGAGAIGSAVAYDLAQRDAVESLQVCDARPRVLKGLRDQLGPEKLRCFQANVRDEGTLESLIAGSDVVVSCAEPSANADLAQLALEAGAHFCDLGGDPATVEAQLALGEAARERSRWIVPNCGLAPGLASILALRGVEQFDTVDSVLLRVGDLPTEPVEPFKYRLAHSAENLVDSYTTPVARVADGAVEFVDPLTGVEPVTFERVEPPLGALEAFYAAGTVSTLPDDLAGRVRRFEAKTIRYRGHAEQFRFLIGLGFADKRSIDVRTHLSYRDVLIRKLRQRLGGDYVDVVLLRVQIEGEQGGQARTLVYEMAVRYDEATGLSAMQRATAVPAAAMAVLLAERAVPGGGAAPPEQIVPHEPFFADLARRGLEIETTWHDGWLSQEAEAVEAG